MKKKIISLVILLLLILAAAILWQWKVNNTKYFTAKTNLPENAAVLPKNIDINFQFDNDSKISLQYPYSSTDENSLTLLHITQQISQEQQWQFVTEDYDTLGILITQIKDKINGQDQKYWQYKINQKTPLISADKYILQAGDLVEWEFRASEL